jgi:hypothetical protein
VVPSVEVGPYKSFFTVEYIAINKVMFKKIYGEG